jgi:hypothetical protein
MNCCGLTINICGDLAKIFTRDLMHFRSSLADIYPAERTGKSKGVDRLRMYVQQESNPAHTESGSNFAI